MALTAEQVNKIAHLARVGIDSEAVPGYAKDLSGLLDLVEQMNDIDTSNVVPMAHPMDQAQRLREDSVTERDQHEQFQSCAPQVEADLYLVPKVIE